MLADSPVASPARRHPLQTEDGLRELRVRTLGDAGNLGIIRFPPDRKSVAVRVADTSGSFHIWIYDVLRGLRGSSGSFRWIATGFR